MNNIHSFETLEEADAMARFRSNWKYFASPEKYGVFWVVRVWDEHGDSWLI